MLGWTRDGKILVRMNRVPWSQRMGRYYVVDPKGGLETPLVLPEGGSASFSEKANRSERLTDFPGTDNFPM